METFIREKMLIGETNFEKLQKANILIFGVGGVGGYVCEALIRSGIESFTLVDHDQVSISNINRQIIALHSTIGEYKVDVMKKRMLDINPKAHIETKKMFYLPENENEFDFKQYDYVIDCIDTITAKLNIIERCKQNNIPIISSMGAGNRLDPTKIQICDIYQTKEDPLSKVMRHELRKRGINSCKVAFSTEKARKPISLYQKEIIPYGKHITPGSSAFVPSAFGLVISSEVVKNLLELNER